MSKRENKSKYETLVGWAAIIGAVSAVIAGLWVSPDIREELGLFPLEIDTCDERLAQEMEDPLIKRQDNGSLYNLDARLLSPSFEEGFFPWKKERVTRAIVLRHFAISENSARTGKCYLAAHNGGGHFTDPSVFQDIGYVNYPSRLNFSIWVKNRRETPREVQLELWDNHELIGNSGKQKVTTNWKPITVSGDRKTGGYVRVEIRWFDSSNTYLMLDDADLSWE
ncbi:hypothetical protein IQ230_05440 [Gloeocapsopsis crepidinum LEGE 06123]|uniref:Uncharacterized protein n=1 Tax=Gloeocapsopsis crepidinum LEGE 06123 TaxID=588587 RepID=A0ABR9UNE3_9CHRO|nr:hypothetical protein [Gloeocapsopsis crepidinum]MBE9189813.1 hypothetical protein [Gloeocapsopsis crepidinum LEGE 06123]